MILNTASKRDENDTPMVPIINNVLLPYFSIVAIQIKVINTCKKLNINVP